MFTELKYKLKNKIFSTVLKLEESDDDKTVVQKIEEAILIHQCGVSTASEFQCVGIKIEYGDGETTKEIDKSKLSDAIILVEIEKKKEI